METLGMILGLVVGLGLLILLFKPFFGNQEEFMRCVGYLFKPDIFSWFQGDWGEDFVCTLKLQFWLGLGVAAGAATFFGILSIG